MFTGLSDQQVSIMYGVVIYLIVAPLLIVAASIAGILVRMTANQTDQPHPGKPA